MDTTSRTTTFRRRFGGGSVIAATLLFAIAEVLYPTSGDDPAAELATNAQHHGQLLMAITCGLLSSILFIPAFFALMNPVRRRGAVLAHLGGGLALLGVACSGLTLAGVQFVMYEASARGVDQHAVAIFIGQATSDPVGLPLVLGHDFFVLGILLLAIGLLRGRVGYRWAAFAFGAGPLLDAVLGTLGVESGRTGELIVSVVTDGLFIAGAAGLAWWQLTTSGAAWEGDRDEPVPARSPQAEPLTA